MHGSSNLVLNGAFIYLALETFWQQRQQLTKTSAFDDDRLIGHILILGGVVCYPLCLASASLQALIWMLIVLGIGWSTWGLDILRKNALWSILLLVGLYPDLGYFGATIWHLLTPHNTLENLMAWIGGIALQAIGQAAISHAAYITLPSGSVEVAPGCSGFDMAFTLAGTGLILGLFFKQRWFTIVNLVGLGILIALVFNVPRIMLVTMAAVYWGKSSFEFWHGPIGGQLFATVLFTVYYYLVMWLINQQPKQVKP